MADTVNLYAAKTDLSKLVDRTAAGEEIVNRQSRQVESKAGATSAAPKKPRGGQYLLGLTYIAEDFDAPLPSEIQKYFE